MSKTLEHGYRRLAENPSMEENAPKISSFASSTLPEDEKTSSLNFKETELRLGLPGSESPERKSATGISLFGMDLQNNNNRSSSCSASTSPSPLKNLVAGAKRVFSDSFNESSGKWVFSVSDGSEVDLGKNATFFCPRGVNIEKPLVGLEVKINNSQQNSSVSPAPSIKEVGLVSQSAKSAQEKKPGSNEHGSAPAAKAQVVGWPPIRSFRKNSMASNLSKNNNEAEGKPGFGCLYVKVSMDGAPYLRKVDLKNYSNYVELSSALERMFSCFTIGQCSPCGIPRKDGLSESSLRDLLQAPEYVLTYEDKDGDWMLVGDVPWEMFTESCRRLRIMKGSEAIGLAPRAMEKSRSQD